VTSSVAQLSLAVAKAPYHCGPASPTLEAHLHRKKIVGKYAVQSPDSDLRLNGAALAYYPRLCAVAKYVRAHLTDRITLTDVSRVADLERKYFSAYFYSKVGISFTEWLRLVRVTRSKDLMEAREASIPRLAFASGFRDVRTFERTFKRIVGVPPAMFRASVRPGSRRVT
jgi:transcriptional regulator GlxA family with amidase domain